MPVDLIRGAQTQPAIAAIHAVLTSRIPIAKDQVVDGAAHMAPLTHTSDVAAIIGAADQEIG
jgi:pimeloyl-ACP methyl ester carboxylesterase